MEYQTHTRPTGGIEDASTEHVEAFSLSLEEKTKRVQRVLAPPPYQPKYVRQAMTPAWPVVRSQYQPSEAEAWFAKFLLGVALTVSVSFIFFVAFVVAHFYIGVAQ